MTLPLQTVYTVEDYYDGPRTGVADYNGQPHYYRSIYLDSPNWNPDEDRFELSPVSPEVVSAAVEKAEIFIRWHRTQPQNTAGVVSEDDWGALPEDRDRRDVLQAFLEARYAEAAQASRIVVHGKFLPNGHPPRLRVQWTPTEAK